MLSSVRKKFFKIMAETYEQYSFPSLCGWIEALMLLEAKEWTQMELSNRLSELFPNPDSSTSLSSINRAIKILEEYGTVNKLGSRKIGYYYTLNSSSQSFLNMFQYMLNLNDNYINNLIVLKKTENFDSDNRIYEIINTQLEESQKVSTFFRKLLASYK